LDSNGNKQFFIPRERLGVLDMRAQALYTEQGKRKRQSNLRTLARVLKDLKLIEGDVRFIAVGTNYLGEQGLLVLTGPATPIEPSDRVEAELPN
jgi:hypothetical protein